LFYLPVHFGPPRAIVTGTHTRGAGFAEDVSPRISCPSRTVWFHGDIYRRGRLASLPCFDFIAGQSCRWASGRNFLDRDFRYLRRLISISLRKPGQRQGKDEHQRSGGGDRGRAPYQSKDERLPRAILPLSGDARPQTQLKVSGSRHRLKAADQLAQTRSFRAKAATRRAKGDMRERLIA
jgi:hypothetical protein